MNFVPLFEQLLFDFSSNFFSNFKLREKISHFDYRNVALDVSKKGGVEGYLVVSRFALAKLQLISTLRLILGIGMPDKPFVCFYFV